MEFRRSAALKCLRVTRLEVRGPKLGTRNRRQKSESCSGGRDVWQRTTLWIGRKLPYIVLFVELLPAQSNPVKHRIVLFRLCGDERPCAPVAVGKIENHRLALNRIGASLDPRMFVEGMIHKNLVRGTMIDERTISKELDVLVCDRQSPNVFPGESFSRTTAHGNVNVPALFPRGVGRGFIAFDARRVSGVAKLVLPDDSNLIAIHLVASNPVFRG